MLVEILKQARTYVAESWTHGFYAKTSTGHYVSPLGASYGTSCCVVGALMRAAKIHSEGEGIEVELDKFYQCHKLLSIHLPMEYSSLVRWNDVLGRSQEEAVALYDKAIAEQAKTQQETSEVASDAV